MSDQLQESYNMLYAELLELRADLARRDASLLTEGEQKEILSYIRGNYDRDKIPTWLLDLIDELARRDEIIARLKEDAERLAAQLSDPLFCEAQNDSVLCEHRALMKEVTDD